MRKTDDLLYPKRVYPLLCAIAQEIHPLPDLAAWLAAPDAEPAADGCKEFLHSWLPQRHTARVGPEGYVFPGIKNPKTFYSPRQIQREWTQCARNTA